MRSRGPEEKVVVNAFLDNGSDTTLISTSLLSLLGLLGSPSKSLIKTLVGERRLDAIAVSLELTRLESDDVIHVWRALAVSNLPAVGSK